MTITLLSPSPLFKSHTFSHLSLTVVDQSPNVVCWLGANESAFGQVTPLHVSECELARNQEAADVLYAPSRCATNFR